jgi:hypothetical protein
VLSADEIRRTLVRELESAHREFASCLKDFGRVIEDFDALVAESDRRLALRLAGDRNRRAFDALQKATDRYNGFVLDGIVPDDLQKPGEKPSMIAPT